MAQKRIGDLVLWRLAFEVGHGDEGLAVNCIDFVDGANAGVIERGGCLSFPEKPLLVLVVL